MNYEPTPISLAPFLLTSSRDHQDLRYSLKIEAYQRKAMPEVGKVSGEVWDIIGLKMPKSSQKRYKENLAALLVNLYVAWQTPGNPFLAISLNRNSYGNGQRLNALHFRYQAVKCLVDALKEHFLVELHSGFFDGVQGRQTRIRATRKLTNAFIKYRFPLHKLTVEKELVVLRDVKKKPIDICRGRHAQTAKPLRNRVEVLNSFHGNATWELAVPEEIFIDYFVRRDKKLHPPNPTYKSLHRIFNLDFKRGGRFYGVWPQSIPKELRPFIYINGSPTIERDYRAIHPTILYALADVSLKGDPYIIDGYEQYRKPIKLLFNMAINAGTETDAFKAFRHEINSKDDLKEKYSHCTKNEWLIPAYAAMCYRHRQIKEHLSTGVGVFLQRIDSEIAEHVLFSMYKQSIPTIPIHDSFIVPSQFDQQLAEAMAAASMAVVGVKIPTDLKEPVAQPFASTFSRYSGCLCKCAS